MPHNDGHDFTIMTTISADQAPAVVTLAGDLDIDAWPELDDAATVIASRRGDRLEGTPSGPPPGSGPAAR